MKKIVLCILSGLLLVHLPMMSHDKDFLDNSHSIALHKKSFHIPNVLKSYSTYGIGGALIGSIFSAATVYYYQQQHRITSKDFRGCTRLEGKSENIFINTLQSVYVHELSRYRMNQERLYKDLSGEIQVYIAKEDINHAFLVEQLDTGELCVILSEDLYALLHTFIENKEALDALEVQICVMNFLQIALSIRTHKDMFTSGAAVKLAFTGAIVGGLLGSLAYGIPVTAWKSCCWARDVILNLKKFFKAQSEVL